jgi:hypothetical protein
MRTQTVYVKPNDATAVLLVGKTFPCAKRVADDTKLGADRLVGETEARTEV